jgi:hypothetical protein
MQDKDCGRHLNKSWILYYDKPPEGLSKKVYAAAVM